MPDPYADFCQRLDQIPWLDNLGKPHPQDKTVCRILDWDMWLGPEDSAVTLMTEVSVYWQEQLAQAVGDPEALSRHWDPIESRVLALAQAHVPYEPDQDPWYAPNAAVWSAAWFAALAGCWLWQFGDLSLPWLDKVETQNQWRLDLIWGWFAAGHWPCSFYWTYDTDQEGAERLNVPKFLIVY